MNMIDVAFQDAFAFFICFNALGLFFLQPIWEYMESLQHKDIRVSDILLFPWMVLLLPMFCVVGIFVMCCYAIFNILSWLLKHDFVIIKRR